MALPEARVRIGKACTGIKATTETVMDAAVYHSLLISQFNFHIFIKRVPLPYLDCGWQ